MFDICICSRYNKGEDILTQGGNTMEKKIITISREFGSGGRTIGHKLADRLGIPFYDKELVEQVALESGFAPKFVEER